MAVEVITVWACDECDYWRQERSTMVHQTTNPEDPGGRMVSHVLRPVSYVIAEEEDRAD